MFHLNGNLSLSRDVASWGHLCGSHSLSQALPAMRLSVSSLLPPNLESFRVMQAFLSQSQTYGLNAHYFSKLFNLYAEFSSVQFNHSVMSDSLRPHESQHARHPCPSPTPGVHPDSHPSSQWCHPAISFSVVPVSSCSQSLPASVFSSESVLCIRWPKYWSFSISISPSNEYSGLISLRMD